MREKNYIFKGINLACFLIIALCLAGLCGCMPQSKAGVQVDTSDELKAYYLNVGQSDCTVITAGGETMIVDAGDHEHAGEVLKFLSERGIKEIKYLVLTHSDTDHIGGAQALMYNLPIENLVITDRDSIPADQLTFSAEKLYAAIEKTGTKTMPPTTGERFNLGDAPVEILGPTTDYQDKNENSICLKVTHGENEFLFTGDAGIKPEDDMIDAGEDLSCKVLQAGHHGASESNGYRLLREAYPEYVVISCGYNNQYGHPHEECLSRINDQGAQVFRTDIQGTIVAISDGRTVSMTAERNNSASDIDDSSNASDSDAVAGASDSGASAESGDKAAATSDGAHIGNTKTKKFHEPSCGGLPAEKNRIYFDSVQEAIDAGYDPCGNCNP